MKLTTIFIFGILAPFRGENPVIVCHCKAVRETSIRDAVRAGARCHRSVARACKAGGMCGGCRPAIEEIIEEEQSVAAPHFAHREEVSLAG
jgi:bacterioferritin-associated ferredoxin